MVKSCTPTVSKWFRHKRAALLTPSDPRAGMAGIPSHRWTVSVVAFCVGFSLLFACRETRLCYAGDARASSAEAERLIKAGTELRKKERDPEAVPLFEEAARLDKTPRTQALLGLVYQAVGRWLESEANLLPALAAKDDPWVRSHREPLEAAMGVVQVRLATIEVIGSPTGAKVRIDHNDAGILPARQRIVAGTVLIEVSADGFYPAKREVSPQASVLHRETFELKSIPAGGKAEAQSTERTKPDVTKPTRTASTIEEAKASSDPSVSENSTNSANPSAEQSSGLRIAAWATAGGAAALLLGGTIELVSASGKLSDFERTPAAANPARSCGTDLPDYGGGACVSLHEDWSHARTLGLVGILAGGALAATSVVLFIASAPAADNRSALACVPAVKGLGFGCMLRF